MPEDREIVLAVVIRPAHVLALLREAATIIVALLLAWVICLFGLL